MRSYSVLCSSFLLHLLLLGVVEGYPGGVEYQFRYNSRAVTGLPSLKQQYAAMGLQADLTMQVTERGEIILKMSNVGIGYFNDELHCDPSAPVPIQYHPLNNENITKAFTLTLNGTKLGYMGTPVEPAWVINIRKAVTNIVSVPPLLGHKTNQFSFTLKEDTMAGECETWYSLLKLSGYQAILENQRQEATIEEDEQATAQAGSYTSAKTSSGGVKQRPGSKTSSKTTGSLTSPVPGIKRDLWTMTRSVKYESCRGGFSLRIHGNKAAGKSIEQSSTSQYLVRGELGAFRLERAVVTGSISVFPDPHDQTHSITAITNQTLELVAVRPLRNEIRLGYKRAARFNTHFSPQYLPGGEPGRRPSLTEALTGVPLTQEMLINAQDLVVSYVKLLAQSPIDDTPATHTLVGYARKAVDILADFTQEEIDVVESKLPKDGERTDYEMLYILQHLVIGTGTDASVNYILNKLENRDTFSIDVHHTLFLDAVTTIKNPAIIPRLLDVFVNPPNTTESARIQEPFVAINIAKLVHDLCLSPDKEESVTYTSCNTHRTCDAQLVLSTFLPALREDMQNVKLGEDRREAALQALCNLGTPSAIDILQDVILGITGEVTTIMRVHALYCLDAHHMPTTARTTILGFLTPIIDNIGEVPEVRSLAFLTMATWKPDVTWWHRMALSTWHEPSAQVASFISSTLASLARGTSPLSELAGRSVHLAKPSAPASLSHSTFLFLQEVVSKCEGGVSMDLAWLASTQELFPIHALLRLLHSTPEFGEQQQDEVLFYQRRHTITPAPSSARINREDKVLVLEELKRLMDTLEVNRTSEYVYRYFTAIWNGITLSPLLPANAGILPAMVKIGFGLLTIRPWYIAANRLRWTTYALPTDIGVPLVVKYTKDLLSQCRIKNEYSEYPIASGRKFSFHTGQETNFEIRALLPYEGGVTMAAGITNTFSTTARFKGTEEYDRLARRIKYTIEFADQDEVEVVHSRNLPYTILTSLHPGQSIPQGWSLREINTFDIPEEGELLPAAAGVSLRYFWHSDIPLPDGPEAMLRMAPVFNNWEFRVILQPQLSTTTKVFFSPIWNYRDIERKQPQVVEVEELGQVSQGAADYEFTGQVSQSSSSDNQGSGQEAEELDRLTRLEQEVEPERGGWLGTMGFAMQVPEADDRGPTYEAALTWSYSADHKTIRLILGLTTLPSQGTLDEPKAVCFDLGVEKPPFPPRRRPIQPEDLRTATRFNIHYGTSCNSGPPVMRIEGTLDISADALAKAVAEHKAECGHIPASDRDIFGLSVCDQLNFHAVWNKEMPPYLLTLFHHLDDHLRVWLHPHITYDHTTTHPPHSVKIHATRSLSSGLWNIVTEEPDGTSLVKYLETPFWFHHLAVPADLYNLFFYRYVNGANDPACVISTDQVRTHDGKVYSFEPTNCWTTATFPFSRRDFDFPWHDEISIQVRFTDQWEVRLLYPWLALNIEATREALMLNGEIVNKAPEAFLYYRTQNGITVDIPLMASVSVSDSVVIRITETHFGNMIGLCGAYDGEQTNDLRGPKGCLYSDPEPFVHSWSTSGEGCNRFILRANRGKAAEYQEACPHQVYEASGSTYPNASVSCTEWLYHEQILGDISCSTLSQIPHCKQECAAAEAKDKLLKYKCKPLSSRDSRDEQCRTNLLPTRIPILCIPA